MDSDATTSNPSATGLLLTLSGGWAVLQLGRFLLSPLLPAIIEDLAITEATAGIALAAFQLVYALAQYPAGEYSDRWTRSTLLVPGLVLLVVGFSLFGLAGGFAGFLAAAVVVGLGKGLFAIPSRAYLSDVFTDSRGRALGIYAAGTDLGGLGAAGVAVLALTYGTWRTPFVPVAAALAVLTLLYVAGAADGYRVGSRRLDLRTTLRRLLATPGQRRTLLAFALFYLMVGGFINFLPTYLATAKGFGGSLPSLLFAVVFAVGLVVKPIAGTVSDRFPRRTIAAVGFTLAAVALSGLVLVGTPLLVGGTVALLAVGYKTGFPLADAIVMDDAPADGRGADLGAARALFLGANALGPAYVGVVATYAGYEAAFGGLVACLLVAVGLLLAP